MVDNAIDTNAKALAFQVLEGSDQPVKDVGADVPIHASAIEKLVRNLNGVPAMCSHAPRLRVTEAQVL